jgi:hypothetical protein
MEREEFAGKFIDSPFQEFISNNCTDVPLSIHTKIFSEKGFFVQDMEMHNTVNMPLK